MNTISQYFRDRSGSRVCGTCGCWIPTKLLLLTDSKEPGKRAARRPKKAKGMKEVSSANQQPYIPDHVRDFTRNTSTPNEFFQHLRERFGDRETEDTLEAYIVGTWPDRRTAFWFMDSHAVVRRGRIFCYNEQDKHFASEPTEALGLTPTARVRRMFFGEHLLRLRSAGPIGVVEHEHLAVLAALAAPKITWIASVGGIDLPRLVQLANGRPIRLYPEACSMAEWTDMVHSHVILRDQVKVSDLVGRFRRRTPGADIFELAEGFIDA